MQKSILKFLFVLIGLTLFIAANRATRIDADTYVPKYPRTELSMRAAAERSQACGMDYHNPIRDKCINRIFMNKATIGRITSF